MDGKWNLDLSLVRDLGIDVQLDCPLAPYTSVKVGGPADYFAPVQTTTQLIKLVRWARSVELPYLLLGGGSNVLVSDTGVRGLVIHNRCRTVRVDAAPCCDYPRDDRPFLFAESGAAMAGAARTSVRAALTGLEWAVSVPGTVGGAVINNAGAHGSEVKDCLWEAMVLDENGDLQTFGTGQFAFAYRHSSLKRSKSIVAGFGPVVLNANFRLVPGDADEIRRTADSFLAHRRQTQPVEPSLGSTFKNPPGDFAGRLIDEAGLQGFRIGAAEVSSTHANFLVNAGGVGHASASDIARLIDQVRDEVERQFGVSLEPEIQWVGEFDGKHVC